MQKLQQLEHPPASGQYHEVFFDLKETWRGQNWHYVLFTSKEGHVWCGHFREKESNNFLVAELTDNNISLIVSGGHGYIVDINKREKIKDIDSSAIISIKADDLSSSFFVATYRDITKIDNELNEIELDLPFDADGIYLKEIKDRKLEIEFEEIGADMTRNNEYFIDLNDGTIKKHWA
ncbi:MAG: hypothetical protein JNM67_10735 [Bacteroidetes bacterium]|nr:hypothetical protein [Bacteroidota bacterium]